MSGFAFTTRRARSISSRISDVSGRIEGAEYDHWYSRNQNRVTQTWLVCGVCNERLVGTEFKAGVRSAFEAYQQALRRLLSRQVALVFGEA